MEKRDEVRTQRGGEGDRDKEGTEEIRKSGWEEVAKTQRKGKMW